MRRSLSEAEETRREKERTDGLRLLLLLEIPFSRLDSRPVTGEDGENAEVDKKNNKKKKKN